MIPYINQALKGKKVYSQEIVDTTWGHIFTACYPIYDQEEIVGALCIEMDMESSYKFLEASNRLLSFQRMLNEPVCKLRILRK